VLKLEISEREEDPQLATEIETKPGPSASMSLRVSRSLIRRRLLAGMVRPSSLGIEGRALLLAPAADDEVNLRGARQRRSWPRVL